MAGESCLFMHPIIKRALSIYHGTILAVPSQPRRPRLCSQAARSPVEELVK